MGFSNPSISVRVARIVNDIGADESKSLLHAVTAQLGKEGAAKQRLIAAEMSQLWREQKLLEFTLL